jgi:hypothetical protein
VTVAFVGTLVKLRISSPECTNLGGTDLALLSFEKWDGGVPGLKNMYGGKVMAIECDLRMHQGNPEISVRVPSQIQVVK